MSEAVAPAPAPAAPAAKTTEKPAAPAAPPEKKEAPVEQEISARLRNVLKDRFKGKPAPKEEKKPEKAEVKDEKPPKEAKADVEKKSDDTKADTAGKAKDEEKPKPAVKVARKPVERAPDIEEITTKAATAAVKAALETSVVKKPGQKAETDLEKLPESYREDVPVLKRMEEEWPDKYKGLSEKFIKASLKIEAYKNSWEQTNPGKTFDPDDEEHAAFINANEVDWNDRDYGRALARIEAGQLLEKEREKTGKKVEELENQLTERELEPAIHRRQGETARSMIEELDKEFVNLVEADGRINHKELERLRKVDRVKVDTLMAATGEVARFIDTAERLFHKNGKFKFDDKNNAHLEVGQFLVDSEDMILGAGEDAQFTEDGRRFATREEFAKLDERARKRRWRLELPDLVYLKRKEQTDKAKKELADWEQTLEQYAQNRGFKKDEKEKSTTEEKAAKRETAKPAAVKPDAPSGGDGVKIDTMGSQVTKPDQDFRSRLKAALRGQTVA